MNPQGGWQPYAGPISFTNTALPVTPGAVMRGATPWRTSERQAAVRISSWDLPDFPDRALCSETDGDLFFPDKGGSASAAKAICKRCDARDACLKWALDRNEQWGIWGGMSAEERAKLRRRAA